MSPVARRCGSKLCLPYEPSAACPPGPARPPAWRSLPQPSALRWAGATGGVPSWCPYCSCDPHMPPRTSAGPLSAAHAALAHLANVLRHMERPGGNAWPSLHHRTRFGVESAVRGKGRARCEGESRASAQHSHRSCVVSAPRQAASQASAPRRGPKVHKAARCPESASMWQFRALRDSPQRQPDAGVLSLLTLRVRHEHAPISRLVSSSRAFLSIETRCAAFGNMMEHSHPTLLLPPGQVNQARRDSFPTTAARAAVPAGNTD